MQITAEYKYLASAVFYPVNSEPEQPRTMIVVTGGASFIGSNLIKELNNRGFSNIVAVDDLGTEGAKFRNLADCQITDLISPAEFRAAIRNRASTLETTDFRATSRSQPFLSQTRIVYHYGGVSAEANGADVMDAYFTYGKEVFNWCQQSKIRFIYASSSSVYGAGPSFSDIDGKEAPLTPKGYCHLLLDQYVAKNKQIPSQQVAGLRLFSIYGPGEQYKGSKASVINQFYTKRMEFKAVELFGEYAGYEAGQQKRDFVHVEDVARLNCWFYDHPEAEGIFNVGTGKARSFQEVAMQVVSHFGSPEGYIRVIQFPHYLKGKYQNTTCADISSLRRKNARLVFRDIEKGVPDYMDWLDDTLFSHQKRPEKE
ncbi:uncharacterized protein N7511_010932 [Penicillium nucicola]|uniref:uncharacterized protein n=1 Tax=Penicillium nucicola TaxID=1850975 RepID=UPI002545AA87|nr:uncharacterized protein N7511_010932 [Penicillium nucicola]KAJ5749236.1 hypothetical protein N7511_010932 [Penicillium nucicola]